MAFTWRAARAHLGATLIVPVHTLPLPCAMHAPMPLRAASVRRPNLARVCRSQRHLHLYQASVQRQQPDESAVWDTRRNGFLNGVLAGVCSGAMLLGTLSGPGPALAEAPPAAPPPFTSLQDAARLPPQPTKFDPLPQLKVPAYKQVGLLIFSKRTQRECNTKTRRI